MRTPQTPPVALEGVAVAGLHVAPRPTAAEFEALCKMLWGNERTGWQRGAASFLSVNLRNVQFFAAEAPHAFKPVPPGVWVALREEVRRRAADTAEASRMTTWADRHERQLRAMREALADH